MKKIVPVLLCLTLLSLNSCIKKITDTANKIATDGSMTANVGGKSYTAGAVRATRLTKSLAIRGSNAGSDERLDINLDSFSTGKTKYTIAFMTNMVDYFDTKNHHAVYGEVEIQNATDKSVKGTFSFTTEDSMKVTGGNFDVHWE